MRTISFIFLFLLLLVASSAFAERRNHPQFEIEIANIDSSEYSPSGVLQGTTISVPIIVNKATHKISGFDFTINYDINILLMINVQPGSYLLQNNWEQFEYEFLPDTIFVIDSICPVVNIRGSLSDDNSSKAPLENVKPGDTLAIMNFYVTRDLTYECQSIPIEFFWGECRDNIIYSWPMEKVFHASKIFNHDDSLILDFENAPSSYNSDCIYTDSDRGRGFNKRVINYKNGRVKIICINDIDDRGCDLAGDGNGLNGISDWFSWYDAMTLILYYLQGINLVPDSLIECTDIDNDGIPLTFEDLVWGIKYGFGGTGNPFDSTISGGLVIEEFSRELVISTNFEKPGRIIAMKFYAPSPIDSVVGDSRNYMPQTHSIQTEDTLRVIVDGIWRSRRIPPDSMQIFKIYYSETKPKFVSARAVGEEYENIDLSISMYSPISIKIGKLERVIQGTNVSIPVTKISGNSEMYSFDFLIGYNNSALTFLGATENSELFDIPGEYEWEYFTYSIDENRPCDNGCPSGLIRFVGIANQKSNSYYPKSFDIADNTTLFTINFYLTGNLTYKGEFLPISFFWKDCTDNAIRCKGAPGNPFGTRSQMALSNRVFNAESRYDNIFYEITDKKCGFPSLNGSQEECYGRVNSGRLDYVLNIDFYNGGIKIIGCDLDTRGDVNLNGIDYEVADAVIFLNYFIYGLEAFTINIEGQTANTDINADGIPLTVEDLVHLIRVIVGDALAYSDIVPVEYFSGELHLEDNENTITVSGEFEKKVGAIHLCFYAPGQIDDVKLTDAANHMTIRYAQKNDSLKILIYSMEHRALSPDLNNYINIDYTGDKPVLACASVAGHKSEKVLLRCYYDPTDNQIETTLPEKFTLYQNYPNPFNPYTEIKFNLPRSSDVTLDIYDITGRKVRTLINRKLSSGSHSVIWNGRNGTGRELSTGIYLYRLSTGKYSNTKKMLLLK